jgi:GT2 family glycosyltransferase
MHILAVTLNAASLLLLLYWGIAIFRFSKTARSVPKATAGLGLGLPERPPSVCVIVPAHDEERSIGTLIDSLRRQDYPNLRVVLCLDRCTDGTLRVACERIGDDARFEVLEIAECPPEWAGKVNAIWRGVRSPTADASELLIFADADTEFAPGCVRATVALLVERKLDLLSLLSTLTHDRWFEKLAQPAAGMEMVRQYPIDRANRRPGERRRPFANGQFMLVRREPYERVGGHEAVKDELLEDIALARHMGEADLATGLMLADGLLRCRMYDSWEQFRGGWKRIYTECAKLKVSRLRRSALVARTVGSILPLLALVNLSIGLALIGTDYGPHWWPNRWIATAALSVWLFMMLLVYRAGRTPLWAAPGAVIGSWLTANILKEAARELEDGVPVKWGGREYVRKPR